MAPTGGASVLKLLAVTPRRIAKATKGCDAAQLKRKPAPDSWSANEVLAHLRACADVWGNSITAMLTADRPTLRYVSPRGWIRKTNYIELEFQVSFQAFTVQRQELLKQLRVLRDDEWLRGARIKQGTSQREETVLSYAERMARHEAGHCGQIKRALEAT